MDAKSFLSSVWPSSGFYCIAMPFLRGKGFDHQVFTTIAEAAAFAVAADRQGRDVYFSVHTLEKTQVWDGKAKDQHGTEVGKWRVRVQSNMWAAQCFFGDIDVGSDKPYKTRKEAIFGLDAFLKATKLPRPTVVSSGGGFHIYWRIDQELRSEEWVKLAGKLKALANHFNFGIDPARTTDRASVLRVPGTRNHKDPLEPKPVRVLHAAEPMQLDTLLGILERNSVFVTERPIATAEAMLDEKLVTLLQVGRACGVVRKLVATAESHTEPQWHAFLGVVNFVQDGRAWAHKVSKKYLGYTESETDDKLDNVAAKQTGPTRCQRLNDLGFSETCAKCWYKAHMERSSPVVAARRMGRTYAETEVIPPPPDPFRRLEVGGIARDEDGVITIISPFDVYPTQLIENHETGEKVMHCDWNVELPLRGVSSFRLPLRTIQDQGVLAGKLSDKGVMLQFEDIKHMRQYMSAYIQKLQQSVKDNRQHLHLGWTEDFKEFVLPSGVVNDLGHERPAVLSDNVRSAIAAVSRKGTLQEQVKLLTFYNHEVYLRQQFMVGCSFAAPIFYMTGQHGIIVNAEGESGASKSTTLYTAASVWGDGEGYTINGTNTGATANARMNRVAVLANLPVTVDEITYMETDEAKNLALSITQKNDRVRLDKDAKEKVSVSDHRSTIMLTSSNGSLHEKLSTKNIAGVASSMRVFEIPFPSGIVHHTKHQADDYLRGLRQHHGHLGPVYAAFVTANRFAIEQQVIALMREIDIAANIMPHERFWSACIAAVIVGLRIARRLGLIVFNPEAVMAWALKSQLPLMRGVIETNYSDPIDMLVSYINASRNDVLVVNTLNGRTGIIEKPSRELGIRYEIDTGLAVISFNHLKNYCSRRSIPLAAMVAALELKLQAQKARMSLGRGIAELGFGQTRVLTLSLKHEAIMGKIDLAEATAEDSNVVNLRRGTIR